MRVVKQKVELLFITPNATKLIEKVARTCYKSEGKITKGSADKLISKLYHHGHHAMLEFADATFRITCDRGISHELVRHRLCSFAQESTRYCNYSQTRFNNEIQVIAPPNLTNLEYSIWFNTMEHCESTYNSLIRSGCKPGIARAVLPTCLKTEINVKANLREWLHIVKLRSSKAAHPQIREIAGMIQEALAKEVPVLFDTKENNSNE